MKESVLECGILLLQGSCFRSWLQLNLKDASFERAKPGGQGLKDNNYVDVNRIAVDFLREHIFISMKLNFPITTGITIYKTLQLYDYQTAYI